MNRLARLSALLVASVAVIPACGETTAPAPARPLTVMLDWTPNPIHAGLLLAQAKRFDRSEGVAVTLRTPASSSDGARLLLAGRVDLAVIDIHDLALARAQGRDLRAVMAITGRPLAAVIGGAGVRSPRQLTGRQIAITGVPSDRAVARTIVRGAGGSPADVKLVNAGYGAVAALLAGNAAGAIGFANEEGVEVQHRHPNWRVFRADSWGAPSYPELVLVTTAGRLAADRTTIAAAVRAFVRGTKLALSDPAAAREAVVARTGKAGSGLLTQRMAASLAALPSPDGRVGAFDAGELESWARWEAAEGLVPAPPAIDRAFDGSFTR